MKFENYRIKLLVIRLILSFDFFEIKEKKEVCKNIILNKKLTGYEQRGIIYLVQSFGYKNKGRLRVCDRCGKIYLSKKKDTLLSSFKNYCSLSCEDAWYFG